MADVPKCTWVGESGAKYIYFIHSLPITFDPGQNGNYIYSKKNDEGKWVPIYFGEGDLSGRVCEDHHQWACIMKKGATHVHEHLNPREEDRTAEEADLLANYTYAYKPNGCNEREGG